MTQSPRSTADSIAAAMSVDRILGDGFLRTELLSDPRGDGLPESLGERADPCRPVVLELLPTPADDDVQRLTLAELAHRLEDSGIVRHFLGSLDGTAHGDGDRVRHRERLFADLGVPRGESGAKVRGGHRTAQAAIRKSSAKKKSTSEPQDGVGGVRLVEMDLRDRLPMVVVQLGSPLQFRRLGCLRLLDGLRFGCDQLLAPVVTGYHKLSQCTAPSPSGFTLLVGTLAT